MIEQLAISHPIQTHILDMLKRAETARFSELRPSGVDTNLYSYHLKSLVKVGLVTKQESRYSLSAQGMSYVGQLENSDAYVHPHLVTMLVVQNSEGDILLQRRTTQPFINEWSLPSASSHVEETLTQAAHRFASKEMGISAPIEHAGVCYVRTTKQDTLVSVTLAQVFRTYDDSVKLNDTLRWARPHKLAELQLAPAVEEIMTRTFFRDPFYFEEFEITRK